jgi:hypothetical protein
MHKCSHECYPMIGLLGSSYTRGAWGDDLLNPDAFVHNILSKYLNCDVVNMSLPSHGSEQYTDAFVFACRRWKPKLFLAELIHDRTFFNAWIPTADSTALAKCTPIDIYHSCFAYGTSATADYHRGDVMKYKISKAVDLKSNDMAEKWSKIAIDRLTVKQYFNNFMQLSDYMEHDDLYTIRNIKSWYALEELSALTGIPVLWYSVLPIAETFTSTLPVDRHLNTWCNIECVIDWANNRLHGRHLADSWHLNKSADELVSKELFTPFIKNYVNANNIILS